MSDSLWLHGLWPTRLLCPWGFSRPEYWSRLLCPPPGNLPNPGIEPWSPALQVDSLPSEPPGKPKSTGVGSWSLLQGDFLTQEWNWGLLHCRWILYQLSYPWSPNKGVQYAYIIISLIVLHVKFSNHSLNLPFSIYTLLKSGVNFSQSA